MKIAISKIKPSPDNAAGRSEMNEAMEELIATIKAVGVCEGISVRPSGKGYEVIGGERRLFAAKKAGINEVDVIVHNVTPEHARWMRLASLSHEDWEYEEFAKGVWRELESDSDMTIAELTRKTGLGKNRLHRAQNYILGQMEDAVIYNKDGDVLAQATAELQRSLKKVTAVTRKAVADKINQEYIDPRYEIGKLFAKVSKVYENTVEFGIKPEPEKGIEGDKDYEEHNFELDAVLQVAWGEDNYEAQVKSVAEAKHKENLARWTAQRFGKKELKVFAKGANDWKDELRKILKFKKSFTWEQAQFTLNLLDEVDELVKGLTTELESVMEAKDNG